MSVTAGFWTINKRGLMPLNNPSRLPESPSLQLLLNCLTLTLKTLWKLSIPRIHNLQVLVVFDPSASKQSMVLNPATNMMYIANTGCTDTMLKSQHSLISVTVIPPTPIFMENNSSIEATGIGPIRPPIPLPELPDLLVPGNAESLLLIG